MASTYNSARLTTNNVMSLYPMSVKEERKLDKLGRDFTARK